MNIKEHDFASPWFIHDVMDREADVGYTDLFLENGEVIHLPTRMMLFNAVMFRPFFKLGIPLDSSLFISIENFKSDTISKIQSIQYEYLLEHTDKEHHTILWEFWYSINDLYGFILQYLGAYQKSMSILSLAKIHCNPKVKAILDPPLPVRAGTKPCEQKIAQKMNKLTELIGTRGALEDNVLLEFMETGSLKKNQIPQQMIAYGPRSDIDDSMIKHIIDASAMSGLRNAADLAVESLSAKKAAYFSKIVICDTQYFARVLRLHSMPLLHRYAGNCGSTVTIPITIPEDHAYQFMHKVVFLDGEKLVINEETIPKVIGKRVSMISPIGCRHRDGICEHCCGRGTTRPWAYLPDAHPGIFAATKVGRAVSQMILSTKHLIRTQSMEYILNAHAQKYMQVVGTDIFIRPSVVRKLNKCFVRVPASALGHLADLDHGTSLEENFSSIEHLDFIDANGNIERVEIRVDRFIPYFSAHFLKHLSKVSELIESTEEDEYVIPLAGFNTTRAFLRYVVINDDMLMFVKKVESMLRTELANRTSVTNALQDFTSILYSKTSVNVYFVEILLKAFLRDATDGGGIPIITDPNNVQFGSMDENIIDNNVSVKLGHERLGTKHIGGNYFADPKTSVVPKGPGLFDPLFGF